MTFVVILITENLYSIHHSIYKGTTLGSHISNVYHYKVLELPKVATLSYSKLDTLL